MNFVYKSTATIGCYVEIGSLSVVLTSLEDFNSFSRKCGLIDTSTSASNNSSNCCNNEMENESIWRRAGTPAQRECRSVNMNEVILINK